MQIEPSSEAAHGSSQAGDSPRIQDPRASKSSSTSNAESEGPANLDQRDSSSRTLSRDMSPPEAAGSVRYTRTGRVSRASKGQRVHTCDICEKTYTRNEHLRRHQQNHKPGAYSCDVPGCDRSFYREDLLIRHKLRGHEPLGGDSAQPSPQAQDATPSVDATPIFVLPPSNLQPTLPSNDEREPRTLPRASRTETSEQRISDPSTQKHFNNLSLPQYHHNQVLVHRSGFEMDDGGYWSDDSSVAYSGYLTPIPYDISSLPYPAQGQRPAARSNAPFSDLYPPGPTSFPGSLPAMPVQPHRVVSPWVGQTDPNAAYASVETAAALLHPFGNAVASYTDMDPISSSSLRIRQRDVEEEVELAVHGGPSGSSPLDVPLATSHERYLESYWTDVHPQFPIVHRGSYERFNTSPLLKAAMLSLGASVYGTPGAREHARTIHERCVKILNKRSVNHTHTWGTLDMQAIVLVEVYSLFKSRRPPLYVSQHFEKVYSLLANDIQGLSDHTLPFENFTNTNGFTDGLSDVYEIACRRRLLAACYILDQEHALLFGRPRSIAYHPAVTLANASWQPTWEDWREGQSLRRLDSCVATNAGGTLSPQDGSNVDEAFRLMLLLSTSLDSGTFDLADEGYTAIGGGVQIFPKPAGIQLARWTLMLCKTTPIRELLAVAGESWVMSEKLTCAADHKAAQILSNRWAQERSAEPRGVSTSLLDDALSISSALHFAIQILAYFSRAPAGSRTGLFFEEWSLYLASLVLWASAYGDRRNERRPSLTSSSTSAVAAAAEPQIDRDELDATVSNVIASGPTGDITLDMACHVLMWTRQRIQAADSMYHCGLNSCALDVLGKLIARGSETGWLG